MKDLLFITYDCGIQTTRVANTLSKNHDYNVNILAESTPESFKGELLPDINIQYVNDRYPVSLYRPYWTLKAVNQAKKIVAENNIDVLLSRHVPIAPHIVSLYICKKYHIPWVAHFGDPWIGNPYADGLIRKIIYSKNLERTIVDTASASTFPTQRLKKMYKNRYSKQRDKFFVVPNSVDPSEISAVATDTTEFDPEKLTLIHTGNFYGLRTPEPLFDAIELLNNEIRSGIEVFLVGDLGGYDTNLIKRDLDDVVYALGTLSKEKTLSLMKGADVAILIDAPIDDSIFLPNKLVEYLFAEKPILGITPKNGTSADVIRNTKSGNVVSPEDPTGIANQIEHYLTQHKKSSIPTDHDIEEINKYSTNSAVSNFATLLSRAQSQDTQQ